MRIHHARSGPHSVHDARQYAWSLLILGPGAPAPRQRPHPGMLPDISDANAARRRRSLIADFAGWFRRAALGKAPEAKAPGAVEASDNGELRAGPNGKQDNHHRLAA